jgi:hypothetical protein
MVGPEDWHIGRVKQPVICDSLTQAVPIDQPAIA